MINKSAIFSPCRKYRYVLKRIWNDRKPFCLFICLNPSTADENIDDPTVRRCIRFAESWGYGGMVMCNLFAFRSTNPKELYKQENRSMQMVHANELHIRNQSKNAGITIIAWGTHGNFKNMGNYYIHNVIENPHHLGLTKNGFPKHPLYLKKTTKPIPFKRITK